MAYTFGFSIALDADDTGLTLYGQLVDTAGTNVGAAITTGFVEVGEGNYYLLASIPDAHRGGIKIYNNADASLVGFGGINPEEAENIDAAVSGRAPSGEYNTQLDVVLSSRAPTNEYDTQLDANMSSRAAAATFTGITSLAAWLRGLYRKDAMDATAKTEANTGGGAYSETTDSNEALRDTAPMGTAMYNQTMRGTDSAALAATALSTAVWTAAKAAFIDDSITDIPTLVAETDLAAYEAAAKTGTKLGNLVVASRAGIAGKMTISGTTVTFYEVDGTTVIWTATLDEATAPTERGAPA